MILAGPKGETIDESRMENTFRDVAHRTLGTISELADRANWTPAQFAAARAYLEVSTRNEVMGLDVDLTDF